MFLSGNLFAQNSKKSDSLTIVNNIYTISFDFTGEVKDNLDSVFALHYILPLSNKLILETEETSKELDLSQFQTDQNIQIKKDSSNVHLYILNYDRYNLPIPVSFQRNQGEKQILYLKKSNGNIVGPKELKEVIRQNRKLYRIYQDKLQNNN